MTDMPTVPELSTSTVVTGATSNVGDDPNSTAAAPPGAPWRTAWAGIRATTGALLGLAPHVMHHVGLLAGAALLTGVLGNTVLYVVGLVLSIPLLRRLHRRFSTWKAPLIGGAVFTALFALSALVIGPALNPAETPVTPSTASAAPASVPADGSDEHTGHHD